MLLQVKTCIFLYLAEYICILIDTVLFISAKEIGTVDCVPGTSRSFTAVLALMTSLNVVCRPTSWLECLPQPVAYRVPTPSRSITICAVNQATGL